MDQHCIKPPREVLTAAIEKFTELLDEKLSAVKIGE